MGKIQRSLAACILGLALCQGCTSNQGEADAGMPVDMTIPPLRDVLLVGNSYAGTVSFIDGHTFEPLGWVNIIPDLQERLNEIMADSTRSLVYATIKEHQLIKHYEPGGGDRFVDDLFVSLDGKTLYVSRSNLGDVAAFDLTSANHPMVWRTRVSGFKADHGTLSPDGRQLVVSATTADEADVIDAATGAIVGMFPTGHYPHQNDYSADGKHIYNGSIGDVSLPYAQDMNKGVRQLTVADATTLQVVRVYPFSAGIRPSVITADEKTMYAQLSYLNGLVKFDLVGGTITATLDEPLSAFAQATYPTRDDYPHDSAHHGLAISGDGKRLCDAGTIDDTVAMVATDTMMVESTIDVGLVPYWATTSVDGDVCFVSLSGDDSISVVNYQSGQEMKRVPVGRFPQRSRLGRILESVLPGLSAGSGPDGGR